MARLTDTGLIVRSRDEIRTEIENNLKAAFGNQFDVTPESPDGQLIGIFADAIFNSEQIAQAVYQSADPDTATGTSLEYVSDYNGVKRRLATPTIVNVSLTGTAGTIIPAGSVVATSENEEFTTDRQVTIPATVSATSRTSGRLVINANEVTVIKTPISGWSGVNNITAGTTGLEREADGQLRNRRQGSVISTGTNTTEAILQAVERLGVTFVAVHENDTTTATADVPANSFLVVVEGGSDNDIFQAIYNNKPLGISSSGTSSQVINDSKGNPHTIRFSRPAQVNIIASVNFDVLEGNANDISNRIKTNIAALVNGLGVGRDVIWSQVLAEAAKVAGVSIRATNIAIQGNTPATNDITINPTQRATITTANITTTEV